jgi:hypothetical protein
MPLRVAGRSASPARRRRTENRVIRDVSLQRVKDGARVVSGCSSVRAARGAVGGAGLAAIPIGVRVGRRRARHEPASRCRSGGHAGGQDCQRVRRRCTQQSRICMAFAEDTRISSASSEDREKCQFAGTYDAGGGTRTPDTRIMILVRFGSTAPLAGAGGQERGQAGLGRVGGSARASAQPRDAGLSLLLRLMADQAKGLVTGWGVGLTSLARLGAGRSQVQILSPRLISPCKYQSATSRCAAGG